MTTQCLFCLEEDLFNNPVINLEFAKYNRCSCRIQTHITCWMTYYHHKNGFHCPICHTSFPNEQENTVIPVYVENPIHIVILDNRHTLLHNKKLCFYILGAILLTVSLFTFGAYRIFNHG